MDTKYSDIFELVLALMDQYEIDDIFNESGEDGVDEALSIYLKYASGELELANSKIDISKRDNQTKKLGCILTDGEQLIVAKYVMIGCLSKETHNILQMKLHLQDGEFKTYAEKNNLDGKMNALYTLKEEVDYSNTKKGYNQYAW